MINPFDLLAWTASITLSIILIVITIVFITGAFKRKTRDKTTKIL